MNEFLWCCKLAALDGSLSWEKRKKNVRRNARKNKKIIIIIMMEKVGNNGGGREGKEIGLWCQRNE